MYITKPLKVPTPELMQEMIDKYFAECDRDGIPYSVPNLALACGITLRSLNDYEKRPEFADIVGMAKTKIAGYLDVAAQKEPKTSQHAHFIMKAMYRDIYGDQSKLDLGGQQDNPLKVESEIKLTPIEAYTRMING